MEKMRTLHGKTARFTPIYSMTRQMFDLVEQGRRPVILRAVEGG